MTPLLIIAGVALLLLIVMGVSSSSERREQHHAATVAHRCYEQGLDERATERNALDAAVAYLKVNQPDYSTQDVVAFVRSVMLEYGHDRGL